VSKERATSIFKITLARTDAEEEEICRVYRKAARITVNWSYGKGWSVATSTSRLQSELMEGMLYCY